MPITYNFPWLQWTLTLKNIRLIETIVQKHKPDIIHLHNHMFDLAISAAFIKKKYKIPLVITIHTIVQHPNKLYNIILNLIDRSILKYYVINSADWIICPEKTVSEYIKNTFDKKNSMIIPYGIDILNTKTTSDSILREKYNLENKQIFLSLGHVHELRDRKDIINAMPKILKIFPNFILLIVGDIGTNKPKLLAQKLGVDKSVIFTGSVPHSLIPSFFKLSDLNGQWFHISNPQHKTLGIAALEAMSAGKVVIGTADCNVYGDNILSNGENVILVKPEDPDNLSKIIIDLLQNNSRRSIIGENAYKTIKKVFSWESVCNQTVQLYLDILSNK